MYIYMWVYEEKQVTHTNTQQEQHNPRHDKNNITNDHTKNHPPLLITIEGGAATVHLSWEAHASI